MATRRHRDLRHPLNAGVRSIATVLGVEVTEHRHHHGPANDLLGSEGSHHSDEPMSEPPPDWRTMTVNESLSELDGALELAASGVPVFPCHPDKRPATPNGFKDATTDPTVLKAMFNRPSLMIGMPTGSASGVSVLDVDVQRGGDLSLLVLERVYGRIPETLQVRTRSGGVHHHFKASGVRNSNDVLGPGLDVRGEGGYVLVPPSTGYQKINSAPLTEFPAFLDPKKTVLRRGTFNPLDVMKGVKQGSRDTEMIRLAGWLRAKDFDRETAESIVLLAAGNCVPEFDPDEAVKKVERAFDEWEPNEEPAGSAGSRADDLTQLGRNMVDELFTDQYGQPYAWLEGQSVPVDALGDRLRVRWLQDRGRSAGSEAVGTALATLSALARVGGITHDLKTRFARQGGTIYYETAPGRVWEIDAEGWRPAERPPVRFRKLEMLRPLPDPESGGTLADLTRLIKLDGVDLRLYLATLVSYPFDDIPRPVLAIVGQQGDGKTTRSLLLKRLLDEDGTDFITPSGDVLRQATHRGIVAFDNQSSFPKDFADLACSLVTGAGDSRRALYSNNDEFGFKVKRPVVLNGINIPSDRPDLLQRTVTVEVPPISAADRIPEAAFWEEFYRERGKLLGVVFDLISGVLRHHAALRERPRMADWAEIASALYAHLGWTRMQFKRDWDLAESVQNDTALDSIVGAALVEYMELNPDGVALSPKELWSDVRVQTENEFNRYFPQSPNAFGKELNRLLPALKARGVNIERTTSGKGKDSRAVVRCSWSLSGGSAETADGLPTDADVLADPVSPEDKPDSRPAERVSAKSADTLIERVGGVKSKDAAGGIEVVEGSTPGLSADSPDSTDFASTADSEDSLSADPSTDLSADEYHPSWLAQVMREPEKIRTPLPPEEPKKSTLVNPVEVVRRSKREMAAIIEAIPWMHDSDPEPEKECLYCGEFTYEDDCPSCGEPLT